MIRDASLASSMSAGIPSTVADSICTAKTGRSRSLRLGPAEVEDGDDRACDQLPFKALEYLRRRRQQWGNQGVHRRLRAR
jgi:hypothetical protein